MEKLTLNGRSVALPGIGAGRDRECIKDFGYTISCSAEEGNKVGDLRRNKSVLDVVIEKRMVYFEGI